MTPGAGNHVAGGRPPDVFEATDVATGATRRVPWPLPDARSLSFPFVVREGALVVVAGAFGGPRDPQVGQAYAISDDFRSAIPLGPASYVVASTAADRVWLVTDDATAEQRLNGQQYGASRTVAEVDVGGRPASPVLTLTDDRTVVGAVEGGLLTTRPERTSARTVVEVWDPATDRSVHSLPDSPGGLVWGWERAAVYESGECPPSCPLVVVDPVTGRQTAVASRPGRYVAAWALSPRAAALAVLTLPRANLAGRLDSSALVPPSGSEPAEVDVVDALTGTLVHRRQIDVARADAGLRWSPDGAWLFVASGATQVSYFEPASSSTPLRTLAVPVAPGFLVVAPRPA